jgi:hypothetical protein
MVGHVMSDAEIEKALVEARGTVSVAAKLLGCSKVAIYARIKKNDKFRKVIDREREWLVDDLKHAAFHKALIDKDTTMMIFLLKTLAGFRETSAVEHSGSVTLPSVVFEMVEPGHNAGKAKKAGNAKA